MKDAQEPDVTIDDSELYFGAEDTGYISREDWAEMSWREKQRANRRYIRKLKKRMGDSFFSRDSVDDESRLAGLASLIESSKLNLAVAVVVALVMLFLGWLVVLLLSGGSSFSDVDFVPVGAGIVQLAHNGVQL